MRTAVRNDRDIEAFLRALLDNVLHHSGRFSLAYKPMFVLLQSGTISWLILVSISSLLWSTEFHLLLSNPNTAISVIF